MNCTKADYETLRDRIVGQLKQGPVKSFGSSREASAVTTRLRCEGLAEYIKIKDGGKGWQLTAAGRKHFGVHAS